MYIEPAGKKLKSEIVPLFPTPLYINNIGRKFTEEELQVFLYDNIPMNKDKDLGMAKQMSKDLYMFDSFKKELKDIKDFCEQHLKQYLEEIVGANTDLATLRITQSWLNKAHPQESHNRHYHSNSYLSGVLYINCLPDDHIIFDNRFYGFFNNMEFPLKETTVWNAHGFAQPVANGDLILFPSWIQHHVNENKTKDTVRVSFAFNTFPIGEMGKYKGNQLILKND